MHGTRRILQRPPSALLAQRCRTSILPSLTQREVTCATRSVRLLSMGKPWKGAKLDEHSVPRAKRGDTYDPSADAVASGLEEREVNEGIADNAKSQATTQRGGRKEEKKTKNEHPKAPEPIIGMNDERGQKGG